ncbi:MAG: response regulator [Myxococcales bacterium]
MPPLKVALVDDSPTIRSLVTSMLHQLGSTPLAYASAAECQQALKQSRPDLLLLDPVLDAGPACLSLSELRAQPELALVPVLVTTTHQAAEDVRGWDRAEADDHLPKPIKLAQLGAKLEAVARAPGRLRSDRRIRVVVLVDGDAARVAPVVASLDAAGYVVLHAADALETRRALQQTGRVDAVLVRVAEPRFEAVEAVRLAAAEFGRKVLAVAEEGLSPRVQDELQSLGEHPAHRARHRRAAPPGVEPDGDAPALPGATAPARAVLRGRALPCGRRRGVGRRLQHRPERRRAAAANGQPARAVVAGGAGPRDRPVWPGHERDSGAAGARGLVASVAGGAVHVRSRRDGHRLRAADGGAGRAAGERRRRRVRVQRGARPLASSGARWTARRADQRPWGGSRRSKSCSRRSRRAACA